MKWILSSVVDVWLQIIMFKFLSWTASAGCRLLPAAWRLLTDRWCHLAGVVAWLDTFSLLVCRVVHAIKSFFSLSPLQNSRILMKCRRRRNSSRSPALTTRQQNSISNCLLTSESAAARTASQNKLVIVPGTPLKMNKLDVNSWTVGLVDWNVCGLICCRSGQSRSQINYHLDTDGKLNNIQISKTLTKFLEWWLNQLPRK